MDENKTREEMLENLDILLNEELPYSLRLESYEYLSEDCEEILDEMVSKMYAYEGETGKMLMEILANYKGNKAIFMGLVSWLYKGEDVALFAKLIGSYGDEKGVEVLKTFCKEYEPNYNEYMELRNAVEELGGDFELEEDFEDDPLYRYLKGLDEEEEDSRRSPFEDLWKDKDEEALPFGRAFLCLVLRLLLILPCRLTMQYAISFVKTTAARVTPSTLLTGYSEPTILPNPKKLKG